MTSTRRTVDQTSHRLVREALRETVRAGPGALERVGSVRYRASAVLYLLLLEHPIDRRGRCRSCPGVLVGLRSQPCQIHVKASTWLLHHPDEALLLSHLARELGAGSVPSPGAAGPLHRSNLIVKTRTDPGDIDVLPGVAGESRTDPSRTPAVPFSFPPREVREAGRPDAPSPDRSLVITGDMPWPR